MFTYIIKTDDYSIAQQKIEEIYKTMDESTDLIYYDLEEDSIYPIIDELNTVSLFNNPKMLVVKSGEDVLSIDEKAHKTLLQLMADTQSSNLMVIVSVDGLDNMSKEEGERFNQLKKYSSVIEMKIKNISKEDYIKKDIDEAGYKISDQAISLLSLYLDNITAIRTALDILKTYKLEEKKIEEKDVILMIPKPLDDNVFDLVNAVLKKDKKKVFSLYQDFKTLNIGSNLVSLLINKFQEIYNVYILVRARTSQDEIARIFNVKPGRAYYMIQNARSISIDDIKSNLEYLNKLDSDIKSGNIDAGLGLELYFLR